MTDSALIGNNQSQNMDNINNNSEAQHNDSNSNNSNSNALQGPTTQQSSPILLNSDKEEEKKGYNDHEFIAQTNYLALLNLFLVNLGCFIGLFYFFLDPSSKNMVIVIYLIVVVQRLELFYEAFGFEFPSKVSKIGTLVFGLYCTVVYLTLLSLYTFAYTETWGQYVYIGVSIFHSTVLLICYGIKSKTGNISFVSNKIGLTQEYLLSPPRNNGLGFLDELRIYAN